MLRVALAISKSFISSSSTEQTVIHESPFFLLGWPLQSSLMKGTNVFGSFFLSISMCTRCMALESGHLQSTYSNLAK